MDPIVLGLIIAGVVLLFIVIPSIRIVNEYDRIVVLRFGKFLRVKGPGFCLVIPYVDTAIPIRVRTIAMDVPEQDVITKDNVSVRVNAVVYYRVVEPDKAIIQVENYHMATSQIAQTTLRSILGQFELDDLLQERDKISQRLQELIDNATDPWGIKVSIVEIKDVVLPEEMKRAMAKQAEAERERKAKIIAAEGELQASQKLMEAAQTMAKEPTTLQLRYLQTLADIATENSSTIVFPVPIDMFNFMKK